MTHDDPASVLKRWVDYGGRYRVSELSGVRAVVDLCTCHGEPVERLESREKGLIEYLRNAEEAAIARLDHEEAK